MADQLSMRLDDVNALADKLDGLDSDLTSDERALLLAVFQVAGAAIESQAAEVQGFGFGAPSFGFAPSRLPLSEGFRNAFAPGIGGAAPNQAIIIEGSAQDPGGGGITITGTTEPPTPGPMSLQIASRRPTVLGDPAQLDASTRARRQAMGVALVTMPFVSWRRPSLQLGLLKPIAESHGFPTETFHLNLELAARIGRPLFDLLCDHRGEATGDWLFSLAAFGDASPDPPTRSSSGTATGSSRAWPTSSRRSTSWPGSATR